jgi:hypothetical protein
VRHSQAKRPHDMVSASACTREGTLRAFFKNLLFFVILLGASYLFFQIALRNGLRRTDDFSYLAHNLHMT